MQNIYSDYLNIIKTHRNNIDQIIDQMSKISNVEELRLSGISERYLDNPSTAIREDRKKYFAPNRYKCISDAIQVTFPKTDKVLNILDIGCGYGDYSYIFQNLGHNITSLLNDKYTEDFQYVINMLNIKLVIHNLPEKFNLVSWSNYITMF